MMKKIVGVTVGTPLNPEKFVSKEDGKSAYEIAVENGFKGTITEWLESLNGKDGAKGEKGDPFTYEDFTAEQLAALKGKDGVDGKNGQDGAKGDPFTYEDFTPEQLAALKGKDGEDGKDGQDGEDGKNGFSPTVEVTKTASGHRIKITDADGEHVFEVTNGKDGTGGNGTGGADGKDGFSPIVEVTETTNGHSVKITDADGEHVFEVTNGKDGVDGKDGQDGAKGDPFTYEDFTAEQLAALKGKDGVDGKDGQDGAKGDPFTYEDFTPEQLAALKGKDGVDGQDGKNGEDGQDGKDYVLTEADKTEIAQQAAALIDTSLAAAIGSGVLV